MLKIDTGVGNGQCMIKMKGTMIDITAELAGAVQGMFETFCKESQMAGFIFLKDFMHCMEHIAEEASKTIERKPKDPEKEKMEFLAFLSLLKAMQNSQEKKDIRSADFDSDEEFKKWFHGGDEE